jgi:hypothetical protein
MTGIEPALSAWELACHARSDHEFAAQRQFRPCPLLTAVHRRSLPSGPAGVPFVPVEFTGLAVTPYVTQAGRLGYSLKASGVRSPGRPSGRPGPDGRESAA